MAGAYGFFGVLALTMTPLELTTPDLLGDAAIFFAFGALLRLRDLANNDAAASSSGCRSDSAGSQNRSSFRGRRSASVALAVRRRGSRAQAAHERGRVRLVFVGPWTGALTRAGRLTFGDTGRLTYAWYVNNRDAPSLGGVPMGARTARTEAILPGRGRHRGRAGNRSDVVDPERWSGGRAAFHLHDQLASLRVGPVLRRESRAVAVSDLAHRRGARGVAA